MPITQVAQIRFRELVSPEEMQEICDGALALQKTSLHPITKKPLVKSVTGGIDHGPDGIQDGMTHVFIFEFDNEDDRNLYQEEDVAHRDFEEALSKLAAKYTVIDFEPGVFERRRSSTTSRRSQG